MKKTKKKNKIKILLDNTKYYLIGKPCGPGRPSKTRIKIPLLKRKKFIISIWVMIFMLFPYSLNNGSSHKNIKQNWETLREPNLYKDLIVKQHKDNKILFCDENIDSSKLELILEFNCSTESQENIFKPKDYMIKLKTFEDSTDKINKEYIILLNKFGARYKETKEKKDELIKLLTSLKRYQNIKILEENSWKKKCKSSTAIGRWQMLKNTRDDISKYLNIYPPSDEDFLTNKDLQKKFMITYFEMCNKEFKDNMIYDKYVGTVINGYFITKCGLLCLSQALGVNGTINWLESGCDPKKLPKGVPIADRRLSLQLF